MLIPRLEALARPDGCYALEMGDTRLVVDPSKKGEPGDIVVLWPRKKGPLLARRLARCALSCHSCVGRGLRRVSGRGGAVMGNVAEITEMLRREDEELYSLVNQWQETYYKYLVGDEDRAELAGRVAALEGQIIRFTPQTFLGLVKVLQMAHMIMSARDADPDCYLTGGLATLLIAQAIDAVDHKDGVIGRSA